MSSFDSIVNLPILSRSIKTSSYLDQACDTDCSSPSGSPLAIFLQARMATSAVFEIANRHGDTIRSGWRNILDCVIRLHKLGLLPTRREQSQNGQGRPSDNQEGW